ncbi:MAG TPA: gliding motility lipoprotein GldD [Bacteroidia bacterium]|jgi:gliding motility-associated lipoprotein GldD|nr:gliding motility lipoprotein GldD [Bacteroidia bacterium]
MQKEKSIVSDQIRALGMDNSLSGIWILVSVCCMLSLSSCGSDDEFSPKPKGYYRIDLPSKSYVVYDKGCPFTFEYPKYGRIEDDHERLAEPCWLNYRFPRFGATLHISYKALSGNADNYIKDSWDLAQKHIAKASAMDNVEIGNKKEKVYGLLFNIEGNAASPLQFYLTDSSRHFLRGALYFNAVPNKDSIAPVYAFIREDIEHMIQTFRWKESSMTVDIVPYTLSGKDKGSSPAKHSKPN